jgi:ribosomal protein S18 acetylase RimI-like enzyme
VPDPVTIRPATTSDATALGVFHLRCWREAYPGVVPDEVIERVARADRTEVWRRRLEHPGDLTLVAEHDGAIVGLATVGPMPGADPEVELRSLYVGSEHHGTGLARRLIDATLGGRAASLWVFERNARAQAFYLREGWRPTGERRTQPGLATAELRMIRPATR